MNSPSESAVYHAHPIPQNQILCSRHVCQHMIDDLRPFPQRTIFGACVPTKPYHTARLQDHRFCRAPRYQWRRPSPQGERTVTRLIRWNLARLPGHEGKEVEVQTRVTMLDRRPQFSQYPTREIWRSTTLRALDDEAVKAS